MYFGIKSQHALMSTKKLRAYRLLKHLRIGWLCNLAGTLQGLNRSFLIYHSENLGMLKNVNKHKLPVFSRSNPKGCMMQVLFKHWFLNDFITQVCECCLQREIPFRILLLLNNAPSHPPYLVNLLLDMKVFLVSNTTPFIQPMDQGSIATYKVNYIWTTFT